MATENVQTPSDFEQKLDDKDNTTEGTALHYDGSSKDIDNREVMAKENVQTPSDLEQIFDAKDDTTEGTALLDDGATKDVNNPEAYQMTNNYLWNPEADVEAQEDPTLSTVFINNPRKDANSIDKKEKINEVIEVPNAEDEVIPDDFEDEGIDNGKDSKFDFLAITIAYIQKIFLAGAKYLQARNVFTIICLFGYAAYFVAAMIHKFGDESSIRLLVGTILGVTMYTRRWWLKAIGLLYHCRICKNGVEPKALKWFRLITRWFLNAAIIGFSLWVIIDNIDDIEKTRSIIGLAGFVLVCLLFSSSPRKINWHTILWGLGLQFIFAICTLKYEFGQDFVEYIQKRLDEFFANSEEASKMIFGPETHQHQILLEALPVVFLISSTVAALYYFGALQLVIRTIGSVFSFILDTHPIESMSVAGGIFLDGTSAILALHPFLEFQSKSQLFMILCSTFTSLGGAYLAILSKFHVPISHILPAMLISAPATYAVCKLIMPETRPKDSKRNKLDILPQEENHPNFLMAFQSGSMIALPLLGNVIATAFAFVAGLSWLNHTVEWFGDRVGKGGLTLDYILSYLLYPVAFAMGIKLDECRMVAKILGIRTLSSNFLAFLYMMPLVGNRHYLNAYIARFNGTGPIIHDGDDMFLVYFNKTLHGGIISERSEVITTFSLCGFSSLISMAFVIAIFYTLVPKRRDWLAKIAIPAMVAGNITNWMTGCFASLFY